MHIPKAGGTTLNHILNRRYRRSEQYHYSTLHSTKSMDIVKSLTEKEKKRIRLYKGHFVFGFHEWIKIEYPKYFTVFRNPIDRVLSHYFYSARKKDHYLHKERTSRNISIEQYVTQLSPEAQNGMSKQIAGVYVNDNFGYGKNIIHNENQKEVFEMAIENINKHFVLVGIMEEFDKTVLNLFQILGGKGFLYNYYKRNINKDSKTEYLISENDLRLIEEFNNADIKLYNYCKAKFNKLNTQNPKGGFEVNNMIFKYSLDLITKINQVI